MNKGVLIKKFTDRKLRKINAERVLNDTRKAAARKMTIRKVMALGLSIIMAVSLMGCSNSETEKSTHDNNAGKKTNTSAEQTAVSEYGYNIEYIDFPKEIETPYQPVLSGNTLYFLQSSSYGSYMIQSIDLSEPDKVRTHADLKAEGDARLEIHYLHLNEDGSFTFVQREFPNDIFSHQGKVLELGDIPEDDTITEEYLSRLGVDLASLELEFSDISGLSVKEFAALYESLTDSGSYIAEAWGNGRVSLITVDAAGNEISNLDITEYFTDITSLYAAYDKEENIYMYNQKLMSSENHLQIIEYSILKVNLQTGEAKSSVIDGEINALFSVPSGEVAAIIDNMNTGNFSVKIWDREKNAFSDKEFSLSSSTFKEAYPAYDDSFYYTDGNMDTLYCYDLSEQKDEEVLKFIDWDISENDMPVISYIDDTHITMVGSCIYRLTKVKASEIVKKQIISLACLYTYGDTKSYIVDFNKTNSEYRIQAKTYLDDNVDYDEAITEFTKDILSNPPDLINLDGLDYARYSGSGIFEDLYPFMQKDEEFKNRNLNQNILKLFETDGKLYSLPASYTIKGLASAKSLLGDEPFTLDKYMEIAAANADKDMFHDMSRENLLKTLFNCNEDYLIDYKAKSCNFTDGTFEKILNITKNFPSEKILMAKAAGEYTPPLQRISEGTLLFYQMDFLYNFLQYQEADFIFDGSFNITGYPSVEGNKIAINSNGSLYAISSQSQYKDICWDFIKKVFDTELETMSSSAFVVDNDLFEANLKQMAEPVMKEDADGNMVEVPQRLGEGNVQMEFYAPSEEMVSELRALVNSVNTLLPVYTAGDIYKILLEEATPFYAEDKTAEEVCKVIQSRINILINEGN